MRHLLSPATWGLLAGLTGLAGYVPYLRDAWRRASDPDPAAWLIWTVEYGVLLVVQAAQHPPVGGAVPGGPAAGGNGRGARGAGRPRRVAVSAPAGGSCSAGPRPSWGHLAVRARPRAWPCASSWAWRAAAMVLVMVSAYRHPGSETPLTWQAFILAGLLDLPALGGHDGAAALRLPGVLRDHGLRGADRRRARRAGGPDAGAAQRQHHVQRDPEAAPPAARPACPAGQWEILRGTPQALPRP